LKLLFDSENDDLTFVCKLYGEGSKLDRVAGKKERFIKIANLPIVT